MEVKARWHEAIGHSWISAADEQPDAQRVRLAPQAPRPTAGRARPAPAPQNSRPGRARPAFGDQRLQVVVVRVLHADRRPAAIAAAEPAHEVARLRAAACGSRRSPRPVSRLLRLGDRQRHARRSARTGCPRNRSIWRRELRHQPIEGRRRHHHRGGDAAPPPPPRPPAGSAAAVRRKQPGDERGRAPSAARGTRWPISTTTPMVAVAASASARPAAPAAAAPQQPGDRGEQCGKQQPRQRRRRTRLARTDR